MLFEYLMCQTRPVYYKPFPQLLLGAAFRVEFPHASDGHGAAPLDENFRVLRRLIQHWDPVPNLFAK